MNKIFSFPHFLLLVLVLLIPFYILMPPAQNNLPAEIVNRNHAAPPFDGIIVSTLKFLILLIIHVLHWVISVLLSLYRLLENT